MPTSTLENVIANAPPYRTPFHSVSPKNDHFQVVDAAMVDGAAHLSTFMHEYRQLGLWSETRGTNMLDGAAHFYDTYECKVPAHFLQLVRICCFVVYRVYGEVILISRNPGVISREGDAPGVTNLACEIPHG